jgi:hypothetical protein
MTDDQSIKRISGPNNFHGLGNNLSQADIVDSNASSG